LRKRIKGSKEELLGITPLTPIKGCPAANPNRLLFQKDMVVATCKRCRNEIVELHLSEKQRLEVWGLIFQNLKLFAVKK
jgi:hypothetical protein